jgi:starch synthase
MPALKIFYVSSEVAPFAKTGGLADIANSFPKALKAREHDIRVMMPKYRFIHDRRYTLRDVIRLRDIALDLPGNDTLNLNTKSAFIDDAKVQIYFADIAEMFNQKSPYVNPETGKDYDNNLQRFAYFSLAAINTLKHLYWQPDIIHCNDWQTALIPVYLKTIFKDDPFFANCKTVFTIHNMAFQGIFPLTESASIGIADFPELTGEDGQLAFHGKMNLLKGAILFSDKITTVSPGYLTHLLENDENAFGLLEALRMREKDLVGILNGIDTETWNPQTDKNIETQYGLDEIDSKVSNRQALLDELDLTLAEDKPLIGFVARLTEQKGVGLLLDNLEQWLTDNLTLVVLGSGDKAYEKQLLALMKKYPERLAVKIGYDEKLSHRIQAASDIFLMPSFFEPCGLTQLYSLRYGTLPLAFHTGGLIDTITDLDKRPETGTGFLFDKFSAKALNERLRQAMALYQQRDVWRAAQERAMQQDFSWENPVQAFEDLYQGLKQE